MNTYAKFCPNVYVARCDAEHKRGDVIEVETKYGKTNKCVVFNLVAQKPGAWYYSVVRADGFDCQAWCKARAERLQGFAANAAKRSDAHYAKSQRDAEFLRLAEPIKAGHHSEGRHRRAVENANTQMGKSVAEDQAAKDYTSRAEYWEARSRDINLSMPDSVEYYAYQLERATAYHAALKADPAKRAHSMSLQYANRDRKEAEKNLELAKRLWGDPE